MPSYLDKYEDRKALVTGGQGFIGSNVIAALVEAGADVTVTDAVAGDRWRGLMENGGDSRFKRADITDSAVMAELVRDQDYVFSLAGLSGAGASNAAPLEHLRVNCGGQLTILEACRQADRDVRIFFPSSQLVYGPVDGGPVKETHATEPTSIYGVHKLAVEKYFHLYHELYGLKTSVLRIPNPYGPGHKVGLTYGIVNFFITELLAGKTIKVFGDGSQTRDYIYIKDLVVAILTTTASDASAGRVFNAGGPEPTRFGDMAKMVFDLVGSGDLAYAPWPPDADRTEIGDIFLDKSEIAEAIGWKPKTALADGLKQTVEFYRSFSGGNLE